MSNPLDGRIRSIAREEAAAAVQGAGVLTTTAPDTQGLQDQITVIHEHLHHAATTISRLEARIDTMEKTAGQPDPEQTAVRRTRRKTTEADG